MDQDLTFKDVFDRLGEWALFPKYQLERRVDIFLTFFLEDFFAREARLLKDPRQEEASVALVAPEFPILSRIEDPRVWEARASRGAKPKDLKASTVNADYLLYRSSPDPAWLLVELKTDSGSIEEEQLRRYQRAQDFGIEELVRHIEEWVKPNSDDEEKYGHLLTQLGEFPVARNDRIDVVYLAPSFPIEKGSDRLKYGVLRAWEWSEPAVDQRSAPRFHPLSNLQKIGPFAPAALWDPLSELIDKITPGG